MIEAYFKHQAITPSDTTVYQRLSAVRAGGAGNLVLEDQAGTIITYAVAAGEVIRLKAKRVRAATTATNVVGLFA